VCIKAASSVRWRGAPPHGRGPAIEGKAAQQLSAVRRHGLSIGRARLQLGRTRSRRRADLRADLRDERPAIQRLGLPENVD